MSVVMISNDMSIAILIAAINIIIRIVDDISSRNVRIRLNDLCLRRYRGNMDDHEDVCARFGDTGGSNGDLFSS